MQMDVYWCQSDTDHSSRWVSNSSQGPPCAGTAEPFCMEPAKLHSHARSQSLFFFFFLKKTSFYVVSKDIISLKLVMEVDCLEMTICNCKLIIVFYCWAEMQEYKQYKWIKRSNHLCQITTFVFFFSEMETRSEGQGRTAGHPNRRRPQVSTRRKLP